MQKFKFEIYYSLLYQWEVWHYQKTNTENIREAISQVLRKRHFANSDVTENVYLFNKTNENIVCNYTLHEKTICKDRYPHWINKNIKKLINDKNLACTSSRQNKSNSSTLQSY